MIVVPFHLTKKMPSGATIIQAISMSVPCSRMKSLLSSQLFSTLPRAKLTVELPRLALGCCPTPDPSRKA